MSESEPLEVFVLDDMNYALAISALLRLTDKDRARWRNNRDTFSTL